MFEFDEKLLCYENKLKAVIEGRLDETLSTVLLYLNAGICNHDCLYCDKNFYDISPKSFDREYLEKLLDDMVELEADSLIILGEGGEPILNTNICWLINEANNRNISCGLYTNGSVINEKIIEGFDKLDFIRISLDAGTPMTHSIIHNYPQNRNDFENAFEIMKKINKEKVSVGAAFVIMPQNIDEIFLTWNILNELGIEFLELKLPLVEDYKFTPVSEEDSNRIYEQIEMISRVEEKKTKLVFNNHFNMFIKKGIKPEELTCKDKEPCYTCSFRTIVSPLGYFLCSPLKNRSHFQFGNPYEQSLIDAWKSEKRKSMVGNLCDIRCTYYKQNAVLNQVLNNGKIDFVRSSTDKRGQEKFL